jgi:signal transduction histidine kinase
MTTPAHKGSEPLRWDREDEIIDAVAAVASGEDVRVTLERLVYGAVEFLDAQYGALGLRSPDGALIDFIHVGMDPAVVAKMPHTPEGLGVLGATAEGHAPFRLSKLSDHEASVGFPAGHPSMNTFVGAPVRLRGVTIGTFYVTEKNGGGPFTDEDVRSLGAFASVAGIAVENSRLFERSQRREEWLRASTEVATAILSGSDTHEVLDLVARRALLCARADGVAIMLEHDNGEMVVEVAIGESTEGFKGMVADESWQYSMHAKSSGTPVVIDDLGALGKSDDPNYRKFGTAVLLPLVTAQRAFGAIAVTRNRGGSAWDEQDVTFAESFASQTALALVLSDAQREQERLAVYVDRDRIARDLHDLVIQRLFASGLMLQAALRKDDVNDELRDRLDAVVGELDGTVREIRQTIFELASGHNEAPELRGRILREVANAGVALGFQPKLMLEGPLDSVVLDAVADHTVAALREALSNVVRHAHASAVDVRLELLGDEVVLTVTDDGVGIFPTHRSSGIKNLENRAKDLGGSSTIEPTRADGSGTRLIWRASIL